MNRHRGRGRVDRSKGSCGPSNGGRENKRELLRSEINQGLVCVCVCTRDAARVSTTSRNLGDDVREKGSHSTLRNERDKRNTCWARFLTLPFCPHLPLSRYTNPPPPPSRIVSSTALPFFPPPPPPCLVLRSNIRFSLDYRPLPLHSEEWIRVYRVWNILAFVSLISRIIMSQFHPSSPLHVDEIFFSNESVYPSIVLWSSSEDRFKRSF